MRGYDKIGVMQSKFPKNFYWGVATSSHQIEGDNTNNDWWEAEQSRKVSHKSDKACDSYNRFDEDLALLKELGVGAYRFSLEWSRIETREGEFSKEAIEHYKNQIVQLRENNIEPFVTLHHFTNPIWFSDKGGWESRKSPKYFERYVDFVSKELGDNVKYWITINEPSVYSLMSYVEGFWPPNKRSWFLYWKVSTNFIRAHRRAYRVIKKNKEDVLVGIAKNKIFFDAYENRFFSKIVAVLFDYIYNGWFFERTERYHDFVGVNYYNHNRIKAGFNNPKNWLNQNENKEISDFGWEIYPKGLYHVVMHSSAMKKPVFIFENGIADADDDQRPMFIKEHLRWLNKAIEDGADVRGYFHWSLLDNFEWAEGYQMKFGLAEVDRKTFERSPRPSFYLYRDIIKENGLDVK